MLFYKVGPSPSDLVGHAAHLGRRTARRGRRPRPARRHPRPDQEQAGAAGRRRILCAGSSTEHNGWRVHFERSSRPRQDLGRDGAAERRQGDCRRSSRASSFHTGGRSRRSAGRGSGKMFEAWSEDGGKTWGPLALTRAAEPQLGHRRRDAADGRQLLVYNHTANGRTPLNVAISTTADLEGGRGAGERAGRSTATPPSSRRPTGWCTSPTPGSASGSSTWSSTRQAATHADAERRVAKVGLFVLAA